MNTRDQWFEPGAKVCRVEEANNLNLPYTVMHGQDTDYGRVLCVQYCYSKPIANMVVFVGIDSPPFYARCFRRIEEIQLCVRAAEKFKQNEGVEV